jgi:protein BUR2
MNVDQWYYTLAEMRRSPSALAGYTLDSEMYERSKGCNFVYNVGHLLKLPQITIATAAVFLHRFYMRHSLKEYHYYVGCLVCLIARKLELLVYFLLPRLRNRAASSSM